MESMGKYRGLTHDEADKRLKIYGMNSLKGKKKISPFKIFIEQFNDFIIWVLIVATIISGFMGEKADAITILIIVIMNAFLGFIQEYKTEKSLEALKELAAPTAKVIRNNKTVVINAELLVPGDLILLESGDRVPADCIVIEENNLLVDESLLTGESVGVLKSINSNNNSAYMGTIILTGKATAKVSSTGMKTEMGKIANMLDNIEVEKSPLKERLNNLGKILVILCLIICATVTIMGIARGQDKYTMFLLGVSLAVAAIPEGLPAIVTVSLALGVSRMLKRNALIRKLPAVETLGCTSIICSDKTGTLTKNDMTVTKIFYNNNIHEKTDFNKISSSMLKKIFVYCNDCNFNLKERIYDKAIMGDPTEIALIKAFISKTEDLEKQLNKSKRVHEIPFDSKRKMMSVVYKNDGKYYGYIKGAPEKIIDKCNFILKNNSVVPLSKLEKDKIKNIVEKLSGEALRCIAAAYKEMPSLNKAEMEEKLVFVGIAGMIDPPRPEVKDAVLKCRIAGIKPIMITGDHKNTAFAIAKELNICSNINQVMTGQEIDKLDNKALKNKLKDTTVFARVSPEHKHKIVSLLKGNNEIVAMTGDGVNDAPAVKEADIGISMGISGTDVTKEASSMILLDDNFTTIVAAVEEGRIIYSNIRKFIRYLLSCNLGEVLTMFLSSLFYLQTPLLPIQILFVNLATDGLPAMALGVDPPSENVMKDIPRRKNESVFARGLTEKILLRGTLIGLCTILAFLAGKYYGMNLETCRTLALCTLIISQLIHVFECRSEKKSIFQIKIFTNIYLVLAVLLSIIMLLCIVYVPALQNIFHTVSLDFGKWLIILFFSGVISILNSFYILFMNK